MLSRIALDACRPCLRRLPAGSGRIYRLLGGYRDGRNWQDQGFRLSRGMDHGYRMVLDLGDTFQRETYYLGKFYEWDIQAVMRGVLRPGDTFIDVGANIGMLTLLGAEIVGERGCVLAFEPNPEARAHLGMHILMNRLNHVKVFDTALSSQRQRLTLTIAGDRSGVGTLRQVGAGEKHFEVQTALLDDYLAHLPKDGRVLLKTDVEGYDFQVLQGAPELLSHPEVFVISEVNHEWLREVGSSTEEMFEFMANRGYKPYHAQSVRRGLSRSLAITPLSLPGPHYWFNAVFCRQADLPILPGGRLRT